MKSIVSAALAAVMAFNLGAFAFAEEGADVQTLVDAACAAGATQADIDAAQVAVAKLTESSQKTEYMNSLDRAQDIMDSVLYMDYEDKSIGDWFATTNSATGTVIDDNGNKVGQVAYNSGTEGGQGQRYYFEKGSMGNEYTIELKFKHSGNISDAGRLALYTGEHIFNISTAQKCVIKSDWNGNTGNVIAPDTWYNIIYTVSDGQYTLSVIDIASGEIVASLTDNYTYDSSSWDNIMYYFNGNSADETGRIYVDDLLITPQTSVTAARNAVVKAERSKNVADYAEASNLVAKVEGEYKSSLEERLNVLADIMGDSEFANAYVAAAEKSRSQYDIDTAQVAVAKTGDTALMARLDKLQKKLDSVLYVDYEDKSIGDWFATTNSATGTVIDDNGNKVGQVAYNSGTEGGQGQKYNFARGSMGNEYTIELKFKHSGDISEAGRLSLYVTEHIFNISTAQKCVIKSDWNGNTGNVIAPDTWYNIIYTVSDGQYTLSVVDIASGEIVASLTDTYTYDASNWDTAMYFFNGNSADGTGRIYVDDLIITPQTPVTIARNAVVAAERSKSQTDIDAAKQAVTALDESEIKTGLNNRLSALTPEDNLNVTFENTADGKVNMNAVITTSAAKPVRVIAAVYNQDNRLIKCYLAPEKNIDGTDNIGISGIEMPAGCKVEVMVWNSFKDMNPVFDTVSYPNNN